VGGWGYVNTLCVCGVGLEAGGVVTAQARLYCHADQCCARGRPQAEFLFFFFTESTVIIIINNNNNNNITTIIRGRGPN